MKDKQRIKIYSRCSCDDKSKFGGWGAIVVYSDGKEVELSGAISGRVKNDRLEMMAINHALESLDKPYNVIIYTTNYRIVNIFNNKLMDKWRKNNWITSNKKKVKNLSLLLKIENSLRPHGYFFKPIDNITYDMRIKKLAQRAIKEEKKKRSNTHKQK